MLCLLLVICVGNYKVHTQYAMLIVFGWSFVDETPLTLTPFGVVVPRSR